MIRKEELEQIKIYSKFWVFSRVRDFQRSIDETF